MTMRIMSKPASVTQKQPTSIPAMENGNELGSTKIIIYLFSKPKADQLFISNKPVNLQELIENAKRQTSPFGVALS